MMERDTRRRAAPAGRPRPARWLAIWLVASLAAAMPARAQSPPTADPAPAAPGADAPVAPAPGADGTGGTPPPAQSDDTEDRVLESTRRSVRSTFEWLARGVDSWFGDKPFEEGGKVSDGHVSFSVLERFGDRTDTSLRFNARFRLPNVERVAYLFVGRDDEREIVTDRPDALTRQQRLVPAADADRSFFVGLGVWLRDQFDVRIGLRGGIKPYAQARYRQGWQLGAADLVELRQTFFWTLADRVGSTTALSAEHAFSSTLALRWLNAATITQRTERFEWSSVLGAYKSMGAQRLLALEALAGGRQGAAVRVQEYGLRTRWEQPVYEDWLIGEVIAAHFWPRPDPALPRDTVWALGVGLRMKF